MLTTSYSLLQQLHQATEAEAWSRFVDLYTPLFFDWARRLGLQDDDASDLVQDVFVILVEKLPGFRPDPEHKFRSWVRTILLNRWRNSAAAGRWPLWRTSRSRAATPIRPTCWGRRNIDNCW